MFQHKKTRGLASGIVSCHCSRHGSNLPILEWFQKSKLDVPSTCLRASHINNPPLLPIQSPDGSLKEGFFNNGRASIRYVTFGQGPQVLFFTYGVLGEIRNSFKNQLTAFDPNRFTSIFWDPPGYGKSLPRGRTFTPHQYILNDAACARELLHHLGVSRTSLLGWCDGGHLSILFATLYPDMVDKLVVWGTTPALTLDNMRVYERLRRLSNWSPVARAEALKAYDNDANYVAGVFNQYVDTLNVYFRQHGGNIYQHCLEQMNVPTLVLHAQDDTLVSSQQAKQLVIQLGGDESMLHMLATGGHSVHIKQWKQFNQMCRVFLHVPDCI